MNVKTMPHSDDAEIALLGNFLLYEDALNMALEDGLESEDFYLDRHQTIYRTMASLRNEGQTVDSVTLITRLKDYNLLDKVGGTEYILDLQNAATGNSASEEYINVIKAKSYQRKIIKASKEITDEGFNSQNSIDEILDFAESSILNVTRNRFVNDFVNTADTLDDVIENIRQVEAGSIDAGVKTNYTDMDNITNGFQRGDLIIMAARPSVGKTAFALNIATNVASSSRGSTEAVAVFSLEMGAEQLLRRIITMRSKVNGEKIRRGKLTNDEWNRIMQATDQLKNEKLYIDDTPGIKVSEIFSKCRKLKNKEGLSLVIIDYIQLIGSTRNNVESRQVEVSEISRNLKALARELNVPVIALSQLSRSVERREDKRPMLSDLRESGALEQDADVVMFLYREAYYDRDLAKENNQIVEVNIAKHRNGPTGEFRLSFQKDINAFYGVVNNQ
ncbi:MAG: replicative DNA helicase [Erysipelotrichaceae bacterium]|jgi:replicative DNA helicase|nr:replicative DNA helicase [Erysipelotrichaceae bacterium]